MIAGPLITGRGSVLSVTGAGIQTQWIKKEGLGREAVCWEMALIRNDFGVATTNLQSLLHLSSCFVACVDHDPPILQPTALNRNPQPSTPSAAWTLLEALLPIWDAVRASGAAVAAAFHKKSPRPPPSLELITQRAAILSPKPLPARKAKNQEFLATLCP